jgi:hypothetical protein
MYGAVMALLRDEEATELGELGLDGELIDLLLVSGVDDGGGLAREQREVLLVRGDADVVKLHVAEERRDGVTGVARVASSTTVEDRPPALRCCVDGVFVAVDEAVERGFACELGALERSDGEREVVEVRLATEHLSKRVGVLGDGADLRRHGLGVLHPHLDRVRDRELRLRLERRRTPVPELGRGEHRVQDRRRVALRSLFPDALRQRLVIDEAGLRLVTRRTRHAVVDAESLVVEQLVAERYLRGGRHAIGRDRDRIERRRDA